MIRNGGAKATGLLRRYRFLFFLSGLMALYTVNNLIILDNDGYLLCPDSVADFCITADIHDHLKDMRPDAEWLRRFWELAFKKQRPPLYYLTGSLALFLGQDMKSLIIANNLVYLAVLFCSVYAIGRKTGGEGAGILAVFILSMFPATFAVSRLLAAENALAAMLALALYLSMPGHFEDPGFSLGFGAIVGLGFLTRRTYFVFFLPVACYIVFNGIKNNRFRDRRYLVNSILSLLACLAVASVWYRGRYISPGAYYYSGFITHSGNGPMFYFRHMLHPQLGAFFVFILGASVIYAMRKHRLFMPLTVIFLLAVFTIIKNRQERFIFPVYVFAALMMADFVWSFSRKRVILISILAAYALPGYFIISYNSLLPADVRNFFREHLYHVRPDDYADIDDGVYTLDYDRNLEKDYMRVVLWIKDMAGRSSPGSGSFESMNNYGKSGYGAGGHRVLHISDTNPQQSALVYLARKEKLPALISWNTDDIEKGEGYTEKELDEYVNRYDIIILQEDILDEEYPRLLSEAVARNSANFVLADRLKTGSRYTFRLYYNKDLKPA
ncbi:MAG: glycosyltransferase family 39 protein [Elusimicrobia bacterium]|nr:glycosyltransferase family 39 protein [Elusimicrobiota bacterium]